MNFKEFWQKLSAEEKKELAEKCESSVPTLSQCAHGTRNFGLNLLDRLLDADKRITYKNRQIHVKMK
jgi:hypothetical protein